MPYQDRWVRGAVASTGDRVCDARYALIREVVAEYSRPVTVLDLGANLGYFGCRLADEFGAVSVMIDGRSALLDSCRENAIPTTIAIKRRMSVDDLRELALSEHIDVVLALNVLHHFDDCVGALKAVLDLGDQVIIETPTRDDVRACGKRHHAPLLDALEQLPLDVLGDAPSHVTPGVRRPIVRIDREGEKTALAHGYAFRARMGGKLPVRAHLIESTRSRKTIMYASGEERDWHAGINLWNWAQFGGGYPDREDVIAEVAAATETIAHGDLRPWNFVLQGATVVPIDTSILRHTGPAELDKTIAWLRNPASAYRVDLEA